MPGEGLTEFVPLRVLHLSAKEGRRELVRLVANDQVPLAIRGKELRLDVFVAGELVESGDGDIRVAKPVAGDRGFELVVRENVELEMEAAIELVLPLLGQTARTYDEASLQIALRDHLLHQQAGHDGLAGAGVVGQQEPQRLPRQHLLVDGGDLVRQRFDERSMNGEDGIEQVRQPDAMGLATSRNSFPSPSKLHGLPFSVTWRRSSSERYKTSLLARRSEC